MPLWPSQIVPNDFVDTFYLPNTEWWYQQTGKAPIETSAAWTTANKAVYTPVIVRGMSKPSGIAVYNGATAAGMLQVGLYAVDSEGKPGARLMASPPTPQVAADVGRFTDVNFDDVGKWAGPGVYYLACVFDGATGTVTRLAALTSDQSGPIMGGIFTQATAFPLPAVATPDGAGVAFNVPILVMFG